MIAQLNEKVPRSFEMWKTKQYFARQARNEILLSPEELHEYRIGGFMRFLIAEALRQSPNFKKLKFLHSVQFVECNEVILEDFHLYFEELSDICYKHGWSLSYTKSWTSNESYVRLVPLSQIDRYPPVFYHHTNLFHPIYSWFKTNKNLAGNF